jgi:RimJ/RimL family protein N-acetyltransferase
MSNVRHRKLYSAMYVSQETQEQTERRLKRVLAAAEFELYRGEYAFVEVPVQEFPVQLASVALAFVKDKQVWSALAPSPDERAERFVVFSFHFQEGQDNSGFVGWLASHLKRAVGTGVFVVCGQNSRRGGIFDYWGAPVSVGQQVVTEVQRMRSEYGDA